MRLWLGYSHFRLDGSDSIGRAIRFDGFAVGGGIEYVLSNKLWLMGEYRYTSYGKGSRDPNIIHIVKPPDIELRSHSFTLGLKSSF